MRALYFKELSSFLSSTIGYVFILIFLIASGLFHWILSYNTNLLEGSEADLVPFFNLSPVIFLVLIPAITMKSFAEEKRTGTIELLFTRPISDLGILMAKYLAGVTLLIIAIAPGPECEVSERNGQFEASASYCRRVSNGGLLAYVLRCCH